MYEFAHNLNVLWASKRVEFTRYLLSIWYVFDSPLGLVAKQNWNKPQSPSSNTQGTTFTVNWGVRIHTGNTKVDAMTGSSTKQRAGTMTLPSWEEAAPWEGFGVGRIGVEHLKNPGLGVRRPRSWPCRLLNVSLGQVIRLFQPLSIIRIVVVTMMFSLSQKCQKALRRANYASRFKVA